MYIYVCIFTYTYVYYMCVYIYVHVYMYIYMIYVYVIYLYLSTARSHRCACADGRLFFFSCPWAHRRRVRYRTMVFAGRAARSTHARHTHAFYQIYCSKAALLNGRLQSRQSSWVRVNGLQLGREHTRSAPGLNLFFLHAFFIPTRPQCNARPKRMPPLLANAPCCTRAL